MTLKIDNSSVRILHPFGVAVIIVTLSSILVRIAAATGSDPSNFGVLGPVVGLAVGGMYALITLKDRYRRGGFDRFIYFLIPSFFIGAAMFVALGAFGWLTTG